LYGRRLVLEWADEENDTVEGLRRKTAAEFDASASGKRFKRAEILGELREMAVKGGGASGGEAVHNQEDENDNDNMEEEEEDF